MDGFQAAAAIGDAQTVIEELQEARGRTLELVAPFSDEQLEQVHSTLLSPLGWDLGHIAPLPAPWPGGGAPPARGTGRRLRPLRDAACRPGRPAVPASARGPGVSPG